MQRHGEAGSIGVDVVAIKGFNDAGGQVFLRMTPGRFEASVPCVAARTGTIAIMKTAAL